MKDWITHFQENATHWALQCFGLSVVLDQKERRARFLEEALELFQACEGSQEEAWQLLQYTFSRPKGEKKQEIGGVMITLATLCSSFEINLRSAASMELERIHSSEIIQKVKRKYLDKKKKLENGIDIGALPGEEA